ncbi:MAG: hypothetical protein IIA61_06055 [Candidatus Marinimicrobia bacterium]|nr:hypothetical protein [Candidatus Neomarinimicrobiota bacterium]
MLKQTLKKTLTICAVAIVAISQIAFAKNFAVAIGARVSSLGVGVEVTSSIPFIPNLNTRVGLNTFSFSSSGEEADLEIKYDVDLTLKSLSGILDWYPFGGGFRLSTGAVLNQNELGLIITPTAEYTIGPKTYTSADLGILTGTIDFDKLAPYVGIGWGNAVREGKRLGIVFDIGGMYQNSPHIAMSATGLIAPTAEQAPDIEEKLAGWTGYLIISLGLTFKLF